MADNVTSESDIEEHKINDMRNNMMNHRIFNIGEQTINNNSIEENINIYLTNPSNTFTANNSHIRKIPSIMETFGDIIFLRLINCSLTNLSNLPPNIVNLDISNNNISEIHNSDIPKTLVDINLNNNNIRTLDLSISDNITILNLSNNPLTNILAFPPNIIELNLSSSNINSTEMINNLTGLQILRLCSTNISNIDNLPDTIKELNISRINMELGSGVISKLPASLTKLVAHCSGIKQFSFGEFPHNMIVLDVYNNELTELPKLPNKMEDIDISRNKLTRITNIPHIITKFDSRMNEHLIFTQEQKNIINNLKNTPWENDIHTNNTDDDIFLTSDNDDIFPTSDNDDISITDIKTNNVFIDSMMNMRNNNSPHKIMDHINQDLIHNLAHNDNFYPLKNPTHKIKHTKIYRV
jgi:hypothetical protein